MKRTAKSIQADIAKGAFRPHTALSTMALAYYQQDSTTLAKNMFPVCPVGLSSDNYYVFDKEDLLRDNWQRKPAYGKVDPAVISEHTETYACAVDQMIMGIDSIRQTDLNRRQGPRTADPRQQRTKVMAAQANIHQDSDFSKSFMKQGVWANEGQGKDDTSVSGNEFIKFSNRNLEEMNLKKVIFHIAESFWYSDLLDGRKLLDGSSLLYPYMRYNLMLGFKYILGGFTTPTDADLQKVKFRAKQETENDVKAGAIRIASDIIFWNTHLLDGSWDLDGSHRLDVTRGYQLGVAIVAMVAFAHNEVTDVLKVRSAYDLRTGSDVRAAIRSEFEADFWNTVYLDGKLLLDGNTTLEYRGGNKRLEASVTHHMGIKREDSDVSVQVITKTRNYWFFDGSNMLNGKKNLNSIYRKEYIQ